MNYTLSMIWFIFTALFLYMTYREWKKSKQQLESLKSVQSSVSINMMGVDFRSFIKELEKSNQESHKITATSYFLAGLTALASFIISLL